MDLKEANLLGDDASNHWYYKAKFSAMEKMTRSIARNKILDIGAGTGFFSKQLLEKTNCEQSICVDIGYPEEHKEIYAQKPLEFLTSYEGKDFELALLMDVLEHVVDDVGLLKSYVDIALEGTHYFITVPAFSFIWSEHDDFLEHQRRYSLSHIEKVIVDSGLQLVSSCYFYGVLFPLVAVMRSFGGKHAPKGREPQSQLTQHHPLANSILSSVCGLELNFFQSNRLAGLSCLCLAKK